MVELQITPHLTSHITHNSCLIVFTLMKCDASQCWRCSRSYTVRRTLTKMMSRFWFTVLLMAAGRSLRSDLYMLGCTHWFEVKVHACHEPIVGLSLTRVRALFNDVDDSLAKNLLKAAGDGVVVVDSVASITSKMLFDATTISLLEDCCTHCTISWLSPTE